MDKQNIIPSKIQLLPEHLVDQIKAGEVVERPSALLKELVENSIDAGSTCLDITIIENGMDLISVEDNGEGMNLSDLPYAFCRHATSKISKFEDIYHLSSYGFRGEALASIAASSRLTCLSTPKSSPINGGKIIIHGGMQKTLIPHSNKRSGTSIFIKDLFYNTPARLKFIKSKSSEKNALKRIIHSFILSNPNIEFRIKWDDSDKLFYQKTSYQETTSRIKNIFFGNKKKIDTTLDHFNKSYENYNCSGYLSRFSTRGHTGKAFYLFINGRLFNDRAIHQAILRSMDKIWKGESGNYFLNLTLPPDEIDVNVHPSKTHIKFNKPNQVISLISAAIKDMINQLDEKVLLPSTPQMEKGYDSSSNQNTYLSYLESLDKDTIEHSQDLFEDEKKLQLLKNRQSSHVFNLDNNYFIALIDDKKILFEKNKLISRYITNTLFANYPIDEESGLTPLLIGDAFKTPSKKILSLLPYFEKIGFLFDRVDSKIILLKTKPNYLNIFSVEYFIYELFIFFEETSKIKNDHDFLNNLQIYFDQYITYGENIIDDELFFKLAKELLLNDNNTRLEDKIAVSLDQSLLGSLFL